MLNSNEKGYAVYSEDLKGCSFEDTHLETCKKYCRKGSVVVEQNPKVNGFSFTFFFLTKFYDWINFKSYSRIKNILWLHFYFDYNYYHKKGKIVYKADNETQKQITNAANPITSF